MLQIKNVHKKYITGDLEQIALNDVSLNLRDNEFVAILGPSGSGKTTLLNVIGGLDRYDSGDLIINGISTKDYSDRDWDSYRNHTIGFVFQSYNLIPHQTVLSNVELALTISGISSAERRQRALDALDKVGLKEQAHKKPNQMSGGQMQRVAIARALVNNPSIVLADEPTGALDSDTSIQVMDLLKEVAKDRLVVMVTHNPELAEEYATRIVKLKDGKIIDDSDEYVVDESQLEPSRHENMGKSSMSFLTSLALSFNNLKTKKGRTFLTSFAGSIGIIGIALILSLSNGVNTYIHNVEEETLSEYPITISSTDVDISAMFTNAASAGNWDEDTEEVNERQTISSFFSQSKTNDLKSLRKYLESDECKVYEYANAVEYGYSVTPQIYRLDEDSYRQVNPDQTFSSLTSSYSSYSSYMSFDSFSALPENEDLYIDSYDVVAGQWPENEHQLVVVLTSDNCVSDLTLYALGLKDASQLDDMIEAYQKRETDQVEVSEAGSYTYDDFLGLQFKLVDVSQTYSYDSKRGLYVDKSDDQEYMLKKVKEGEDLEIVGVVRPKQDSKAAMLSTGISYPYSLIDEVIDIASQSEIVARQKANPDIDVFTGNRFDEETSDLSLDSLFEVDTDALSSALSVDTSALSNSDAFSNIDLSNISLDMSDLNMDLSGVDGIDFSKLISNVEIKVSEEGMTNLFNSLLTGYMSSSDYQNFNEGYKQYLQSDQAKQIVINDLSSSVKSPTNEEVTQLGESLLNGFVSYIKENISSVENITSNTVDTYLSSSSAQSIISNWTSQYGIVNISDDAISKMMSDLSAGYDSYASNNGLMTSTGLAQSFASYVNSDQGKAIISSGIVNVIDTDDLSKQLASAMSDYTTNLESALNQTMTKAMEQITEQVASSLSGSMSSIMSNMSNMFSFDTSAFEDLFALSMSEQELQDLLTSMMSTSIKSYDNNLATLNYADRNNPASISIYPKDFDNKTNIVNMLDEYNDRMEKNGKEDKVISYTDYVATLMSSVTDIIDTISYVLIAFVAISLVVSSIMIGIITYISVLERTKEIGILRALGASKGNVSQVFNAETFIIGLFAGILGIVITLLLLIPGNILIHHLTGGTDVSAILPVAGALILIVISVILTLIGGIIPSKAAAKKDPVTALRTE